MSVRSNSRLLMLARTLISNIQAIIARKSPIDISAARLDIRYDIRLTINTVDRRWILIWCWNFLHASDIFGHDIVLESYCAHTVCLYFCVSKKTSDGSYIWAC